MIQEYFRHDYQTRGDEKIIRLIFELGWEGYGLYWGMVELLYIGKGKIRADYTMIAYELRTEQSKIEKIAKEYGLFYEADGNLRCEAIDTRLGAREINNQKRTIAAKTRWSNANAMQVQCKTDANAMHMHEYVYANGQYRIGEDRIEENKIEQNRIEEKIITHSSPPTEIPEADLVKAIAGPGDNIKCPLWGADKKCKADSGICTIKGARFINGSCFLPNPR